MGCRRRFLMQQESGAYRRRYETGGECAPRAGSIEARTGVIGPTGREEPEEPVGVQKLSAAYQIVILFFFR